MDNKKLLAKPMITTRGFILINDNAVLISKIERLAEDTINKIFKDKKSTYIDLKTEITRTINNFIKEETGRKPIVLPIIINISSKEKKDK